MFEVQLLMSIYCDNQVASKPIFHERTKYIEVDCNIVRERVEKGVIATLFVCSSAQLAHMFTKRCSNRSWSYYVTSWNCGVFTRYVEGPLFKLR